MSDWERWTYDSHNQSLRAARAGAARRLAVSERDRAIADWAAAGYSERNIARLMPLVTKWTHVTRRIVRGAAERLQRGGVVTRCQERECGRSEGSPCKSRPWYSPRRWRELGPVGQLRELSRWRSQVGPEPSRSSEWGGSAQGFRNSTRIREQPDRQWSGPDETAQGPPRGSDPDAALAQLGRLQAALG